MSCDGEAQRRRGLLTLAHCSFLFRSRSEARKRRAQSTLTGGMVRDVFWSHPHAVTHRDRHHITKITYGFVEAAVSRWGMPRGGMHRPNHIAKTDVYSEKP
jgi:3'-phosphoadenosine 5'-phosphosulfate sulfotransferase (PAPS reductase)/FAD synthetase